MDESVAAVSTELLRTSKDPLFRRLRELLPEYGVNVETDALAELFPDGGDQEFGVVATKDRRVFTFELRYGTGDLAVQAATAVLATGRTSPRSGSPRPTPPG